MRTMVVYYSLSGSTKLVAQELAKQLGAELFELTEKKPRGKGPNYMGNGFAAGLGLASKLAALPDLSQIDTVYVGTPVWAGKTTPAVNRFLKDAALAGKTVVGFATHAGPSVSTGEQFSKAAAKKGATFGGFHSMVISQSVVPDAQAIGSTVSSWLR